MKKNDEENHASDNAEAHIAGWVEAYAGYLKLSEGETDEVTFDGEAFTDATELSNRVQEGALSVEVRGGWHAPTEEETGPCEFQILVTTGGPAFRVIGELDLHNQPMSVRAEHRDWGTPWTEVALTNEEQEAVDWFAGLFYYGD